LAELGVVFLMFWVGLEFSLTRLLAARAVVFGLGGSQVVVTALMAGGMAAAPLAIRYNDWIATKILRAGPASLTHRLAARERGVGDERSDHVVLCGYGGIGRHLAALLQMENIPYMVVEVDPLRFREAVSAGHDAILGDAGRLAILTNAGLAGARALAVTFDDLDKARKVIAHARKSRPDLAVIVSAAEDRDTTVLTESGASTVVTEKLEASLTFGAELLHRLGFAPEDASRPVAELRARLRPPPSARTD
jgi:CPA2 family monovalent cation:H+ antiporter-2